MVVLFHTFLHLNSSKDERLISNNYEEGGAEMLGNTSAINIFTSTSPCIGTFIVSGDYNGFVHIFDFKTEERLFTYDGNKQKQGSNIMEVTVEEDPEDVAGPSIYFACGRTPKCVIWQPWKTTTNTYYNGIDDELDSKNTHVIYMKDGTYPQGWLRCCEYICVSGEVELELEENLKNDEEENSENEDEDEDEEGVESGERSVKHESGFELTKMMSSASNRIDMMSKSSLWGSSRDFGRKVIYNVMYKPITCHSWWGTSTSTVGKYGQ